MPPYIAVKPCHSRGRNPFPDTIFSVSRERRKKGDRRVALAHSYLRAGGAVVERTCGTIVARRGADAAGLVATGVSRLESSGQYPSFQGEDGKSSIVGDVDYDTDDYREGFAAFQEKRPPRFAGR